MPAYLFECKKCKQNWEQYLRMKEKKESKCPICQKQGKRIFTVPQANIGTKLDPFNMKELTEKTGRMKGTVGDLFDFSKEMSDKRAHKLQQEDPIRKKALDEFSKKRNGLKYKDTSKSKDTTIDVKLGRPTN